MIYALNLHADSSALEAAIEELGKLLSAPNSKFYFDVDGFLKFRDPIRNLLVDSFFDFSKLGRIDSHQSTDGTGDVLLSFEPSELFLEFLSALRAGDFDAL